MKHSLIKNRKLFVFLDKNLQNILNLKKKIVEKAILESCKIKKQIVEKDEKEKNLRKNLNFGHTFGHAYEATLNYSAKLNHGEAVLYGILSAIKLSKKLNILERKDFQLIFNHLKKLKFINLKVLFSNKHLNKIINFMIADKKNISKKINIITLKRIGKTNIYKQYNIIKIKKFIQDELLK